ncbi:MAG: hypothetical protein ACXWQO_14230 [Bdellovibrionota bacterium]
MKVFAQSLAVFFLLLAAAPVFAEDNAAPKDSAVKAESSEHAVLEKEHTDLKADKMETRFDATKHMNACMKENNNKQLCAKAAMAECMKSLSKIECRKAVKGPKK